MHLERAALRVTLQQVARHLNPNGQLLIDLENPFSLSQSGSILSPAVDRNVIEPETKNTVTQYSTSQINQRAQSLHVTWIYEVKRPTHELVQRLEIVSEFHYYFPHEIELALSAAGLRLEALYGDYGRSPFNEMSERLLVLASL
jgi:hypothetical protein